MCWCIENGAMVTERDIEREIGIEKAANSCMMGKQSDVCLSVCLYPFVRLSIHQSMLYTKTQICHTNAIIGCHTAIISTMSVRAFAYAYNICIYKSIKKVQKQMRICFINLSEDYGSCTAELYVSHPAECVPRVMTGACTGVKVSSCISSSSTLLSPSLSCTLSSR